MQLAQQLAIIREAIPSELHITSPYKNSVNPSLCFQAQPHFITVFRDLAAVEANSSHSMRPRVQKLLHETVCTQQCNIP